MVKIPYSQINVRVPAHRKRDAQRALLNHDIGFQHLFQAVAEALIDSPESITDLINDARQIKEQNNAAKNIPV